MHKDYFWWQTGIIYEIYLRSFQDSNNDGTGDLKGIIKRLDYLKWLGAKAVWLTPAYPSPMADFGYDIIDYTNIDPLFGNLADFDELVNEIHLRDLRIIMDLVPNHTSDKHPWFVESRSSRNNPKRDWYMWHDALPDGSPPNNWLAMFGGSAWEWDDHTGQYYYHAFLKEQPDLNWRNQDVRKAIYDSMRFWFERGIDGFRVDAIWHLIKDKKLRNNPKNRAYKEHMTDYDKLLPRFSTDRPEVHEIIREMRSLHDEYGDHLLVGEAYLSVKKIMKYYGKDGNGCHLPANFILITQPWKASEIIKAVKKYEKALPTDEWGNWVIGNHDQKRIVTRTNIKQARVAAMLLMTLKGTPTMYYGDELGMTDVTIPPEEIQDPQGKNMPDKNLSRDPARTPMLWDNSMNAGFTSGKPWLRLGDNFHILNVESQKADPESMLMFYRKLMQLRQSEKSLSCGNYRQVSGNSRAIAYVREFEGYPGFLICLNLSSHKSSFRVENPLFEGVIVFSTISSQENMPVNNNITIEGDEGFIARLSESN